MLRLYGNVNPQLKDTIFSLIDFIKIKVIDAEVIEYFRHHDLLYMHSNNEKLLSDNEQIRTTIKKQYNNILFEFTKYTLYIKFKPHYYFNNHLHNANDFSVLNCIKTLKEFANTFNVGLEYLQIINIEFGLNIILPENLINVKDFMYDLIYHNRNEFYTHKNYVLCRFSQSFNRDQKANTYKIIKAYAKGVQFPMFTDKNTFRFEVKSNRKEYINRLGIYTLQDLLNPNIYTKLIDTVFKEFDDVLIIDDKAKPILSKVRLKNHEKKLEQRYWNKLSNKSRNLFRRHVNAYNDALDTCETHLKKEVRKLMFDKFLELKMCAYLTLYKD